MMKSWQKWKLINLSNAHQLSSEKNRENIFKILKESESDKKQFFPVCLIKEKKLLSKFN